MLQSRSKSSFGNYSHKSSLEKCRNGGCAEREIRKVSGD
jgi:hypothetical protein